MPTESSEAEVVRAVIVDPVSKLVINTVLIEEDQLETFDVGEGNLLFKEIDLPNDYSHPATETEPPTWTNLEFYNKFTLQEKMAFETASVATTEQGAAIAVLLTTFLVNPKIWAADPSFIYGMQSLVAVGVITSERLLEIMDGYEFPE